MSAAADIPLPKDPRHQRFADLVLRSVPAAEAYRRAGFNARTPATQASAASRMLKSAPVAAYMRAIKAAAADETMLTVREKREFLARIVRIPITSIKVTGDPATEAHTDLLKKFVIDEVGEMTTRTTVEKHDPLKAIQIDNDLAGEGSENDIYRELAEALSGLSSSVLPTDKM